MSAITENFNLADGTALTTANTAFNIAAAGIASAAATFSGSAGCRLDATGAALSLTHQYSTTPVTAQYIRWRMRIGSAPGANRGVFALRTAANANILDVRVLSAGGLQLRNSASAETDRTTLVLAPNSWCRLEVDANAGNASCRVYLNPDSNTPDDTLTGTYATTDIGRSVVGILSAATWLLDIDGYEGSDTPLPAIPVVAPVFTTRLGLWA